MTLRIAPAPVLRRRVEMQGFTDLTDAQLLAVAPSLRVLPMITGTLALTAALVASVFVQPWLHAVAGVAVASGMVASTHPLERGVVRLVGAAPVPTSPIPRRFGFGLAGAWLVATGAVFAAGWLGLGWVMAGFQISMGVVAAARHWCFPVFVFRVGSRITSSLGIGHR